ncbi:site-2 protease family protein [Dactylosporangium sp. CA-139066]|uniref:site-2 protease family protein n=1 Tax=Dactylosporangium sp. CA-139066 TaxID=3239930 RepID=UPI003D8B02F9
MRQSLHLATIAGIRVGANWSVLVIAALIVQMLALSVVPAGAALRWLLGAAGAVAFLLSLLGHELAHAFVARAFGVPVERVTLWLFGGVAEFGGEPPSARADLLTAAAGPATSALFGVGAGAVALGLTTAGAPAGVVAVLRWLAGINLLLAAFNLLPGAPLDGGRVLRAVLWRWHGDRNRAALGAARAGRMIGLGLIAFGAAQLLFAGLLGGVWLAMIGWFLMTAAAAEANTVQYRVTLGDVPVSAAMRAPVAGVDPGGSVADAVAALTAEPAGRAVALRTADGRPTGLARAGDLARVPEGRRAGLPVRRVALPPAAVPVIEASRRLADVADLVRRAGTALVVDDDGVLLGLLDRDDVARVAERAALHVDRPGAAG